MPRHSHSHSRAPFKGVYRGVTAFARMRVVVCRASMEITHRRGVLAGATATSPEEPSIPSRVERIENGDDVGAAVVETLRGTSMAAAARTHGVAVHAVAKRRTQLRADAPAVPATSPPRFLLSGVHEAILTAHVWRHRFRGEDRPNGLVQLMSYVRDLSRELRLLVPGFPSLKGTRKWCAAYLHRHTELWSHVLGPDDAGTRKRLLGVFGDAASEEPTLTRTWRLQVRGCRTCGCVVAAAGAVCCHC